MRNHEKSASSFGYTQWPKRIQMVLEKTTWYDGVTHRISKLDPVSVFIQLAGSVGGITGTSTTWIHTAGSFITSNSAAVTS